MESMMYVGKTPWHGLGTPIPEEKKISVREAIIAAKLDWQVELRRVFTEMPEGTTNTGILDHFAVCRTSDNAFLGIVGPDYTPLQNEQALEWFQPFLDAASLERYIRVVFSLPEDKGGRELIPNIIYLFENGRGHREAGHNYWGAYNAVTEYLNYFRGKSQDNTLSSLWFGESTNVNRQALITALKMAA